MASDDEVADFLIEHGGEVGNRAEDEDGELFFSTVEANIDEEEGEELFHSTLTEFPVVEGGSGEVLSVWQELRLFFDGVHGNGSI